MLDLVVVDGHARGIVTRNLVTGRIESHVADAVVLGTGGYGNVYYLSTNAKGSNCTAIWRAYKRGALFANPCFTQIHPTCIPVSGHYQSKLTLMSESLRNDGRIWVPLKAGDKRPPNQIPEAERDYYLERRYPSFGNLVPRDVASRNAKAVCDEGRGVGETGLGVYLDFSDAIRRLGADVIRERYGNLFEMYQRITDEDPYKVPMRIYPAIHYTMGGLWVDYYLMSTIPGLFVIGEANFSDHGANRLGASALMQGLSDGYFILPYTVGDYIAKTKLEKIDAGAGGVSRGGDRRAGADAKSCLTSTGTTPSMRSTANWARSFGIIAGCRGRGTGLEKAIGEIRELRGEFWRDVNVPGSAEDLNQSLEKAGRVADFFELAELMCIDALDREESCGGHFREEYQTPDGEAQRNDDGCAYVAAWEYKGAGTARRSCTRSRSLSNTCIPASGATNNAADFARLASEERGIERAHGALRSERRESGHVDAGAARRGERGPDPEGRGADRVRARLPRRYLRIVRVHDQRHRARSAARDHGVPAHHAAFQGRAGIVHRAVAGQGISGDQGSGGGSRGFRPDHRGGGIHQRADGQRARWQYDTGS